MIRNLPMPESKSGTIAARVTTNNCMFLRKSDHWEPWSAFEHRRQGTLVPTFWGSSGSSVGCGQSTLVPSSDNFSLFAIASPNSILASLIGNVEWCSEQYTKNGAHSGSTTSRPALCSWYDRRSISLRLLGATSL